MHICYLTSEYPPGPHGGIGSFIQTLARSLVKEGHQVSVVGFYSQTTDSIENDQGVQVIRLYSRNIRFLGALENILRLHRKLLKINIETPIDIVEGQENAFAFLPKRTQWKKVIRMHGGHHFFSTELGQKPRFWRSWVEKRSFKKADFFCAVSDYVAQSTKKLLKLEKSVIVIPNPVDTNLFYPRLNISDENGLIVFVGSLCEKKGIRQLVEALPAILKQVPYAHLLVIGRDIPDRETGQSFKEILLRNTPINIANKIEYLGVVEHSKLPGILAKAQVCVYPSQMEAMPIAWLEGMAMGKTVVASQTGPGWEIIQHGQNGLLCDPYQPESIAEQVIRALTIQKLRLCLGINARKSAVEHFSLDVLIDKDIEYYRSCLKSKNF